MFEIIEAVKNTEVCQVALKFFALKRTVGYFFPEVPEREVSIVLLSHFNDIIGVKDVCKIFLGSLVFVKKFLNSLNLHSEAYFESRMNVFDTHKVYVISGCTLNVC